MITLIAAVDCKLGIGNKNRIPWHIPSELKHFQQETVGGVVIMGRKTFESLNCRPLKDRTNIIVSGSLTDKFEENRTREENVYFMRSIEKAVYCANTMSTRIYGVGGAAIYEELLSYADRLLLTEISGEYNTDTHFPYFDENQYRLKEYKRDLFTIKEYLR